MKKYYLHIFVVITLFLTSCTSDDGNCGRLGCLPTPVVSQSVQNTGSSIITTGGGIDGILVYQFGTTFKAYDMQDPDKCRSDVNSRLKVSDNGLSLVSDSGEEFLLNNGQPIKGVSCRSLIQYRAVSSGQIIDISN